MTPFTGLIRIGDKFTWTPYGHPSFSARTWTRLEVTDILINADGEVWIAAGVCNSDGEIVTPEGKECWNEESHFRAMVGEHDPLERHCRMSLPQITTDNPRRV